MTRTLLAAAAAALAACGSDPSAGEAIVGECPTPVNGCSSFTDLTSGTAVIDFGGGIGFAYSPACARVKVGQDVTFQGDFASHPLSQVCGPVAGVPSTSNGTTLTFTFTDAGTYGYQCDFHVGAGMEGAIEVVP